MMSCLHLLYNLFIYLSVLSFRLPHDVAFVLSIIIGAYLVARKFKKVNPTTSYSLFHIFFILSFAFLATCLTAFVYTYIVIKYFDETEGKVKKAVIAGLTPGLFFSGDCDGKIPCSQKKLKDYSTRSNFCTMLLPTRSSDCTVPSNASRF